MRLGDTSLIADDAFITTREPRPRSKIALFSVACVSSKRLLVFRFDSIVINTCMHLVEVCLCVCPHANYCIGLYQFPLGIHVVMKVEEKSRTISNVSITCQVQGHLSEGSRSLDKIMSYLVEGSEIPSPVLSFFYIVQISF